MEIVSNITEYVSAVPTSIALGTFDGVHRGHISVIKSAISDDGLVPAVFTFSSSPQGVLSGNMIRSLATQPIKQRLIESLGVKLFISPSFLEVKDLTPNEFIQILAVNFKAKRLCCGFNFRFGKNGEGNANMLKTLGKEYGIEVNITPPVVQDELPVSSTRIRELISNGEIQQAQQLLSHPFGFEFPVIEGDHRGRIIGTPTINQQWPQNFVQPKFGVYESRTYINGKKYKSVSNIGLRPTVGSDYVRSETYILDYNGDLYGESVYVELKKFLRAEQRFDNIDELKAAIMKDVETVRQEEL
ncbi:MAG: bifunctional riboflavin kinase/FAD synthetase [Clostridia bacterium]|nr:bifunctional riboflavin kinase/FAD synthetase [Clostridia bacterium]